MTFYGISFFKDKNGNKYYRFSPSNPKDMSTPMRYYIEDNMLFLETSMTVTSLSSEYAENDKRTKFVPSVLTELSSDRMQLDGVTYKLVEK